MAVASLNGEESFEVSRDRRIQVESPFDGIVSSASQRLQESIGGHRPRVPVTAFVLIEWIAGAAVVPVTARPHDLQPFLYHPHQNEVRGNLVFDSGPDLVRIYEGQ